MVGASKILTVSYGTFSCTLEGFEEPFSTMKAIAEYFRDLAADDRYFGAEPPTPDAQMLHQIAEREVQRRVEAKIQENGVVLRADSATPPAVGRAQGAPGPVAQAPAAEAPTPDAAGVDTAASDAAVSDTATAMADTQEADDAASKPTDKPTDETPPAAQQPTLGAEDENQIEDEPQIAPAAAPLAFDSVAAKLLRIRAAVEQARSGAAPTAAATAAVAPTLAETGLRAPAAPAPAQIDDVEAADEIAETPAADSADVPTQTAPADLAAHQAPRQAPHQDRGEETAQDMVQDTDQETAKAGPAAEAEFDEDEDLQAISLANVQAALRAHPAAASSAQAPAPEEDEASAQDAQDAIPDMAAPETAETPAEPQQEPAQAPAQETEQDALIQPEPEAELKAEAEAEAEPEAEQKAEAEPEPKPEAEPKAEAEAEPEAEAELEAEAKPEPEAEAPPQTGPNTGPLARVRARVIKVRRVNPDAAPEIVPPTAEDEGAAHQHISEAPAAASEIGSPATAAQPAEDARRPGGETAPDADGLATPGIASDKAGSRATALDEGLEEDDDDGSAAFAKLDAAAATSSLPPEAEAELQAELAAVEREVEAHRRADRGGRSILGDSADDDAMSRLMRQTENQLEGAESRRRLSTIAHLKAAVAAKEADRELGESPEANPDEALRSYRDDLARVVRPRRPTVADGGQSAARRPAAPSDRPAPLVLVSEQRIDRPASTQIASPIRPRRVSASNLAVEPQDEDSIEALGHDDTAALADSRSFAEFAERIGATSLPDLLEAAAAYSNCVEGLEHFTRPQIMRFAAAVGAETSQGDGFSREAGLRSFGALLRDGKIKKVKRGQFAISQSSRFILEARKIAR